MFRELTASDGHRMDCWFETPQGDRQGGIVILQEIFGVTEQLKGVAKRYAAQGYEVAIPALFDRHAKGMVIPFAEGPKGRDIMLARKLDETMMDIEAARAALAAHGGKVGVIGFCWGGGLAIRAAQVLDLGAAVVFYGTRLRDYMTGPLRVPVQAHWGETDGHVPEELREETGGFFPEMEMHVYQGAGHAFANDARPAEYVQDAALTAFERADDFLARNLVRQ